MAKHKVDKICSYCEKKYGEAEVTRPGQHPTHGICEKCAAVVLEEIEREG